MSDYENKGFIVSLSYEKGKSTLKKITINICIKTGKLFVSGVIEKTQFSLIFDNPAVNNLNNKQPTTLHHSIRKRKYDVLVNVYIIGKVQYNSY